MISNIVRPTLNWEVNEGDLDFSFINKDGLPDLKSADGYKAIYRNDTNDLINICKKSYHPTKNKRLIEVVETISNFTGFEIHGYSEFNGGGKVLGYLKNSQKRKIAGFDIDDYMVIGNSHDYSSSFFLGSSKVMIRCHNEFSKITKKLKVQHTTSSDRKIDELIMSIPLYMEMEENLAKTWNQWHNIPIDQEIMDGLIRRVLDIDLGKEERLDKQNLSTRKLNQVEDLRNSINREMSDIGTNLFGLFNGVTYYTTHVKKAKEKVFGNVLGSLNTFNDKAFQFCEEVAAV